MLQAAKHDFDGTNSVSYQNTVTQKVVEVVLVSDVVVVVVANINNSISQVLK